MNSVTLPAKLPNGLTPPLSKCLGSAELSQHRALIGFELEVLSKKVDRFGWDRDRGTAAQERLILDWMDALQDYPLDEVKAACRAAVDANPNRMPNEGHVKAQIIAARAKVVAALPKPDPVEPKRERIDADKAHDILAAAGFAPKRIKAAE